MSTGVTQRTRFMTEFAQLREPVKNVRSETLYSHRSGFHVKTTIAFIMLSILLGIFAPIVMG